MKYRLALSSPVHSNHLLLVGHSSGTVTHEDRDIVFEGDIEDIESIECAECGSTLSLERDFRVETIYGIEVEASEPWASDDEAWRGR